ncbi:MAG: hypothetical protein IJE07_06840 [Clostridia bacterium]|nr:hypothetical protein [Clostridia bacterium]
MKKPSALAEMIAAKALAAPAFQQAWAVHMQAFGPILAPAWPGVSTARVHLTNILNKISRRDIDGAKRTLADLERSCGLPGDAEKALYHFLHGLCGEMGGDQAAMAEGYRRAGEYGHTFYLPCIKLARLDHAAGRVMDAYHGFMRAADCLEKTPDVPQRDVILSSALANAASCLASAGRADEAMALLSRARCIAPGPAVDAVENGIRASRLTQD